MEWYPLALVLSLSLSSTAQADCSTHCSICSQRSTNLDTLINSLTCTLECEGTLASTEELDKCENVLRSYAGVLSAINEWNDPELRDSESRSQQDTTISNVVKRYGGFLKKIDKSKILTFLPRDNAGIKRFISPKYDNSFRKKNERDMPEEEQDSQQEDGISDEDITVLRDATPVNEVKRYGGFLRKFGPKRSYNSADGSSQEELQKRYGGFLRRIRPKLRWDSQKRYGGIFRRHFKISVRSDEEPGSFEVVGR